jgi:hypothetical protein
VERLLGGRGALPVVVAATIAIGAVVGACGEGDEKAGGFAPAAGEKPPPLLPPPPPPGRAAAARWSTEHIENPDGTDLYPNSAGTLVKKNGTEIRGWGEARLRRYLAALFARMQYDFRTGDMASVCKHIDPTLLTGFPQNGSIPNAPCEKKLSEYARWLEEREFESRPLRLLWVRAYFGVAAGVWVEDFRGRRFRVPFIDKGNGEWRLEIGKLIPSNALGMHLVADSGDH